MIDPASSPAPVVLHPTAAGVDPGQTAAPGRIGTTKIWFGWLLRYLSALGGWLRRLPSIEDARKFVVNLMMIAAAILALVVIVNTALRPATVIDAIGVPKELEERGYTSAVVAQRLIDEIIRIGTVAATFNDQIAFSSLPFENKIPKIDVPVAGVSLATFVAQLRELVGIVDTRVSDFDSAQRMVQRLLDRGKAEDRRPAVNLGGVIALAQGRYEEALAVFTGLHATRPEVTAPLLNRSTVRIAMGEAEPRQEAAQLQFAWQTLYARSR